MLLLAGNISYAQKQHIYFMTNAGQYVSKKDSADFIRIVNAPESGQTLYHVFDFYTNGKGKMEAWSSRLDPLLLEGIARTFYMNGNRGEVATFKNNKLVGDDYHYFPNGKLYYVKNYTNPDSVGRDKKPVPQVVRIKACSDSTGKTLAIDGNGYFVAYNNDLKSIAEEGNIKDGQRIGAWKGYEPIFKNNFVEEYQDGKLIRGTSTLSNGTIANYHSRIVEPQFKDGPEGFSRFLLQNLVYPEVDRIDHIQGTVILKFTVKMDGTVSDIKVFKPLSFATNAQAIHLIKLSSGSWLPGSLYGMRINYPYLQGITFVLN